MRDNIPFALAWRLSLIEFCLDEYGTVNRSALTKFFAISSPQASNDLGYYQTVAPGNMVYDNSGKTYRRTREFKPVFLAESDFQ